MLVCFFNTVKDFNYELFKGHTQTARGVCVCVK